MNPFAAVIENAWLWVYTAGMPPDESDDRRAEVRSDHWEFARYAEAAGLPARDRWRRLASGFGDDLAWRVSFGLAGLSRARQAESVLLLAITGLFLVSIPAAVWWSIALAGDPSEPGFQIWYIATQSLALTCTVIGGAACAAYYPRTGRALLLAGSVGLSATLWWTPVVAGIFIVAAVAVVLSLPSRDRTIVLEQPC